MRVDGFAMLPNFSFGTAMTTYAGQNIGAGKIDRVSKGAKQGTIMAVAVSTTITTIILIFARIATVAVQCLRIIQNFTRPHRGILQKIQN